MEVMYVLRAMCHPLGNYTSVRFIECRLQIWEHQNISWGGGGEGRGGEGLFS